MKVAAPTAPRLRTDVVVAVALAVLTLASLGRVCAAGFIDDFDDDEYVTRNPHVLAGLSGADLRWALTAFHSHNWHPLTWLSLQADSQFLGTHAWGYHLTNLLLHTANVMLLFAVLRWLTGDRWRSAAVAALFAVHPLHVESVAWVAERKDVLSGLFWMLTLAAYGSYARRPGPGRYALVALALAAGLATKPTVVTLPCVLLLLDYWPLRRLGTPAWRLVAEKLPLLALSAGCCAATLAAQDDIVQARTDFSLHARLVNALLSWTTYLRQTVWPADLAFFYPHPGEDLPAAQVAAAALLLGGITAVAVWQGRWRPYLPVGWLWYLGTLVPAIGMVQVGLQGHADRYTYLPLIGIFIMAAWGVPDLLGRLGVRPAAAATAAAAVVAGCAALTWAQAGYWHDGPTLWRHTLEVTSDNYMAHVHVGKYLASKGDLEAARRHLLAAVKLKPQVAVSHAALGAVYLRQGQFDDAARSLDEALRLNPRLAVAWQSRGDVAARLSRLGEAVRCYEAALQLQPDSPEVLNNLGAVSVRQGELEQAVRQYRLALKLRPAAVNTRMNLASAAARLGLLDEAAQEYAETLRLLKQPQADAAAAARARGQYAEAVYQLGVVRARQGRTAEARARFLQAVELAPQNPRYRCGLAHALSEQGDPAAAARQYEEASRLAPQWVEAADQLARTLATHPEAGQRDGATAVDLARQVCEATNSRRPEYLDTLAAALAETGRFGDAVATARRALELAGAGRPELATAIRQRLSTYEAGKPWRAARRQGAGD
jgi:tetratricopeptide (TPR) repeat protein